MSDAPGGSEIGAASKSVLDPEISKKIKALRSQVQGSFGKIVMAMMGLPRYRHQNLTDLQHLVLEPLMQDRIAIAYGNSENGAQGDVAGLAIWASVSDEVDTKIREQIGAGVWPMRLNSGDWSSGKTNWLIDVIAPDQQAAVAVLANFRQVIGQGDLRLHPIIGSLVDKETLAKMGARKGGPAKDKE